MKKEEIMRECCVGRNLVDEVILDSLPSTSISFLKPVVIAFRM